MSQLMTRPQQLRRAYEKGRQAASDGKSTRECPYTVEQFVFWWFTGYAAANKEAALEIAPSD
jgi:ribosome modulation factor